MKEKIKAQLEQVIGTPPEDTMHQSKLNVKAWLADNAPLLIWDAMDSPVGTLYMAISAAGLAYLDFGIPEAEFLQSLDPLARVERNGEALAVYRKQLGEYFEGQRAIFDMPIDYSHMTPFQQIVLRFTFDTIPAGEVWTYGQVARALGKPKASRAVGTALARNPVPLVIPCHRVIGSDGKMHGYGAGEGIKTKKWLLHFEVSHVEP